MLYFIRSSQHPSEVDAIIISLLQIRLREPKQLAQDHTVSKFQCRNLNLGPPA